jgi:hypothetical protein
MSRDQEPSVHAALFDYGGVCCQDPAISESFNTRPVRNKES